MPRLVEYRLKINGVTPETLPLPRLAIYLGYLSELLGSVEHLHLIKIEKSSAVPVIGISERENVKVERRVLAVRHGSGPIVARRAYSELDAALSEDDASALLTGPMGKMIEFPGSKRPKPAPPLGPIEDEATIDGELVQISGRDESISVYLRRDRQEQICTGTRAQGKELARHMFSPVRIFGIGSWVREPEGKWELQDVAIKSFAAIKDESFTSTLKRLHSIDSEHVKQIGDVTKFLQSLKEE